MEPLELEWLADKASEHLTIVEVGSFLGRSTRALAEHCPGMVYAFDDWMGPRDVNVEHARLENGDVIDEGGVTMHELVRKRGLDLYRQFSENIHGLNNVRILRGNHADASVIPDNLHPDMVFIDGNHSYDDAKRDMVTWKDRVSPKGLLCGHDTSMDGVFRALMEVFPRRWKLEPLTDIWSIYA